MRTHNARKHLEIKTCQARPSHTFSPPPLLSAAFLTSAASGSTCQRPRPSETQLHAAEMIGINPRGPQLLFRLSKEMENGGQQTGWCSFGTRAFCFLHHLDYLIGPIRELFISLRMIAGIPVRLPAARWEERDDLEELRRPFCDAVKQGPQMQPACMSSADASCARTQSYPGQVGCNTLILHQHGKMTHGLYRGSGRLQPLPSPVGLPLGKATPEYNTLRTCQMQPRSFEKAAPYTRRQPCAMGQLYPESRMQEAPRNKNTHASSPPTHSEPRLFRSEHWLIKCQRGVQKSSYSHLPA